MHASNAFFIGTRAHASGDPYIRPINEYDAELLTPGKKSYPRSPHSFVFFLSFFRTSELCFIKCVGANMRLIRIFSSRYSRNVRYHAFFVLIVKIFRKSSSTHFDFLICIQNNFYLKETTVIEDLRVINELRKIIYTAGKVRIIFKHYILHYDILKTLNEILSVFRNILMLKFVSFWNNFKLRKLNYYVRVNVLGEVE